MSSRLWVGGCLHRLDFMGERANSYRYQRGVETPLEKWQGRQTPRGLRKARLYSGEARFQEWLEEAWQGLLSKYSLLKLSTKSPLSTGTTSTPEAPRHLPACSPFSGFSTSAPNTNQLMRVFLNWHGEVTFPRGRSFSLS